jgi:hypothetical protein
VLLTGCEFSDPVTRPRDPPLTTADQVVIAVAVGLVVVVAAGVLVVRVSATAPLASYTTGLLASGLSLLCVLGLAVSYRSRQLEDAAVKPDTIVQVSTTSDGWLWFVAVFGLPLAWAAGSTATGLAARESSARFAAVTVACMAVAFGLFGVTSDDAGGPGLLAGSGFVLAGAVTLVALADRRERWVPDRGSGAPAPVVLLQAAVLLIAVFPSIIALALFAFGEIDPTGPQLVYMIVSATLGWLVIAGLGRRSKAAWVVAAVLGVLIAWELGRDAEPRALLLTMLFPALWLAAVAAPSTRRWFLSDGAA